MQARGESRSRRPALLDNRPQRPKPRTHSLPPTSPPFSPTLHLQTFIQSLAFFSSAAILHNPSPPSPLILAFPAFLSAFLSVFILLIFSPSSLSSFHHLLRRTSFTSLLVLSALYIFYFVATLSAITLVGPVRALIAAGAHPTLTYNLAALIRPHQNHTPSVLDRRRCLLSALLTLIALAFLVYDATGGHAPGKRAARVRDSLMHTRAGRVVHDKLKTISDSVRHKHLVHSLSNTLNALHFTHPIQHSQYLIHIDPPVVQQPHPDLQEPPNRPQPHPPLPIQHENILNPLHPDKKTRRQLLAVLKEQGQQAQENTHSINKLTIPHRNQPNLPNHTLNNIVQHDMVEIHNDTSVQRAKQLTVQLNQQLADSHVRTENEDGEKVEVVPVPGIAAVLGIALAVSSSFSGRAAGEMRSRITNDFGDSIFVSSIVFLLCTALLFPLISLVYVFSPSSSQSYATISIQKAFPKGVWLGILFLFVPVLLQMFRRVLISRNKSQDTRSLSKGIVMGGGSLVLNTLLEPDTTYPKTKSIYATILITIYLIRWYPSLVDYDPLTFSSLLAATILLCVSMMESNATAKTSSQQESRVHERSRNSSHISLFVMRSITFRGNQISHRFCTLLSRLLIVLKDFISQSRSNKASWQVLNFLLLQTGMALVEVIFASATNSVGLISISADNFLCSVALAIGLLAIRVTTRKSCAMFTYGFSRFESVCGFVNGIMLIYVAVLVVLEAFERINGPSGMAAWHVLIVCFIGITGNSLGLYFLPPESRRENHNVQGIYLHIVANTMAFSSLALTTVVSVMVTNWDTIDVLIATTVAVGMVGCAIPLVVRSGRVLILKVTAEKERALKAAEIRLSQIEGVVSVSALRAWNLSPNSIVASVRLKVSSKFRGEDRDVLLKARSIFASMGVAASQCTIQVARAAADIPISTHVRRRSQVNLASSSTELEGLYIPAATKGDAVQPRVISQLTM